MTSTSNKLLVMSAQKKKQSIYIYIYHSYYVINGSNQFSPKLSIKSKRFLYNASIDSFQFTYIMNGKLKWNYRTLTFIYNRIKVQIYASKHSSIWWDLCWNKTTIISWIFRLHHLFTLFLVGHSLDAVIIEWK